MQKRQTRTLCNASQIDALALRIGGGRMVTIWYKSDIAYMDKKLSGGKKNPLHGRLAALTCKNLKDACNYEKVMQSKLGDPNFKAQHLPWGHWFEFPRIIEHKGYHYLRCYPTVNTEVQKRVVYILDGNVVTDADLIKYIKSQLRPSEADVNDFRYDNLVRIKADGVTYSIGL